VLLLSFDDAILMAGQGAAATGMLDAQPDLPARVTRIAISMATQDATLMGGVHAALRRHDCKMGFADY